LSISPKTSLLLLRIELVPVALCATVALAFVAFLFLFEHLLLQMQKMVQSSMFPSPSFLTY
jgi:hypothetical protein